MRRTSILLDPGLLAELERIARRTGRPTAHVIREALERYAAEARQEHTVLPAFVGLGNAGAHREDEPPYEGRSPMEGDERVDAAE